MRVSSKTGLLPILRKSEKADTQGTAALEFPKIVAPAPFTLKPFSGIYNPFPYACSVLCNHPADFEAKSIVKKAKDTWSSEGKSLLDLEHPVLREKEKIEQECQNFTPNNEKDDNVPEELFRRYTETDSRPVTPTPTLASVVTKNLKIRRCMTPDPTSFVSATEKTLLVLDLRRSHSQETVFWSGNKAIDTDYQSNGQKEVFFSTTSHSSTNSLHLKKKKNEKKKIDLASAKASNFKAPTSEDSDSKSFAQNPSRGSVIHDQDTPQIHEVSSESSLNDPNITKRRGKKTKKGKKTGKDGAGGEKEFQGIPDPGETQVSALENNSKEDSARPSSTEEENFLKNQTDGITTNSDSKTGLKEEKSVSFLNEDMLKQLQRQLDQEVVDSELNTKRKIALEEALRRKKIPKHAQQGEEMKSLKKEFQLVIKDSEKWLSIPRVFTRQSARFELPMDSRVLNSLKPTQYAEKYVFASSERLVLYNHVFNLHKEDPEDDEEKERVLLGRNVIQALGKVMGRPLAVAEAKEFRSLLGWNDDDYLDFRTFAGISATCERVMSSKFCAKILSQKEDPRHEIERADFEALDEKLFRLNPDRNLVKMLKSIRDL